MNKKVLTIDFGTQSCRVAIIDSNGEFLAFEQVKYKEAYFSPKPGYCEQDPEYYYECLCKASNALASKNSELLTQCEAFSVTAFRDTAVYLDENYQVVRPSIIWLDQRQAKLKKKLPFISNALFALVGMTEAIKLNRRRTPAIWLQENEPENWKKIRYYVPLTSYINYRLIGILGDGPSNMIGHFPINFKKMEWYKNDNDLKGSIFNIPLKMLPKMFKTNSQVGAITEQGSKDTGLPVGLKYIVTGNDKACEALGSGAISSKTAHISYGTASTVSFVNKKYVEPEPFLPAYANCYSGNYNMEYQIYRGYWMLTRFTKQFGDTDLKEAEIEKLAPEEVLNRKLGEVPPGSNGLLVQPYWGPGLGRPLAKGSVIGFFDVHTKYHLYRAIIEGIAYELKDGMIRMCKRSKKKITSLTISGGGSRSDVICQITADIFNLPVIKTATYEASSLGCAMATFIGLGIYKNPLEAKEHMVRELKVFVPNKENAEKYDYLYNKVYKNIYKKLKGTYKGLYSYLHINNEGSIE